MTKVGFDLSALDPTFKSHALRGIGRYVGQLRQYFDSMTEGDVEVRYFEHASFRRNAALDRLIDLIPFGRTSVRQHLLYPRRLKSDMTGFSFLHYPAHMDAPAFGRMPYVLTVLDLIPHILRDLYAAQKSSIRFRLARRLEVMSIRHATMLLAISETTANDLVRVLGVQRERVIVTPLGVDHTFFEVSQRRLGACAESSKNTRERFGVSPSRPMVLYVGGHDERKNIGNLIGIMREVIDARSARGETLPLLVLAGRISEAREQQRLETLLRQHDMARDTVNLGYVGDEDLRDLYAMSSLFLFPSLYEGFGLPVLEAMACGVPVVASNTSSIPEVVGTSGVLFNPLCIHEGAQAVLQVLDSQDLQRSLLVSGRDRAAMFTWERTGRDTVAAYRRAQELLLDSAPSRTTFTHGDGVTTIQQKRGCQ